MYGFFIVLHIIICVGMMISVLMQSAKGEGLAGAFGGSSLTGTVFGGRGAAPFLAKATSGLAVAFFLSCIVLTFLSPARVTTTADGTAESAVEKAARERAAEIPTQQDQVVPPGELPASEQPAGQSTDQPAGEQPAQQNQTPPPGGNQEPDPGTGG